MSRIVKDALCEKQYFDNDKGLLYYPNFLYDVDLDSDAALSFRLTPEDRRYALASAEKRIEARIAEADEAKDKGFASVYEMRKYKEEYGEDFDAGAEQISKYVCQECGKACKNPQALQFHLKTHEVKPAEGMSPPPVGGDAIQPSHNT